MSEPTLPRFEDIYVDIVKLRNYCLSEVHPRGRHKARVFRSKLGLTDSDAGLLRDALIEAVRAKPENLRPTARDAFGQRYVLDFQMSLPGRLATVRCAWIVRTGEKMLQLITCFVL